MTHVTCRLTAKNRDQLRNPTLGNRVWVTFRADRRAKRSFNASTHPIDEGHYVFGLSFRLCVHSCMFLMQAIPTACRRLVVFVWFSLISYWFKRTFYNPFKLRLSFKRLHPFTVRPIGIYVFYGGYDVSGADTRMYRISAVGVAQWFTYLLTYLPVCLMHVDRSGWSGF